MTTEIDTQMHGSLADLVRKKMAVYKPAEQPSKLKEWDNEVWAECAEIESELSSSATADSAQNAMALLAGRALEVPQIRDLREQRAKLDALKALKVAIQAVLDDPSFSAGCADLFDERLKGMLNDAFDRQRKLVGVLAPLAHANKAGNLVRAVEAALIAIDPCTIEMEEWKSLQDYAWTNLPHLAAERKLSRTPVHHSGSPFAKGMTCRLPLEEIAAIIASMNLDR